VIVEDRRQLLESLEKLMAERVNVQRSLDDKVRVFADHLFVALEQALQIMKEAGIPGIGKSRRLVHPSGGREGFQVFIEDWSIIFVPMQGLARPNALDEARIPSVQFKEPCGRIAVFLTDDPHGTAFYDFLIFHDGSWFAWGYGWPKQQSDIESTDFETLALELLYGFIKDIFVTWHPRGSTTLASTLDAKKRAYVYGLPGEERQGGG
jgi:hypothetical protein